MDWSIWDNVVATAAIVVGSLWLGSGDADEEDAGVAETTPVAVVVFCADCCGDVGCDADVDNGDVGCESKLTVPLCSFKQSIKVVVIGTSGRLIMDEARRRRA